VALLKRIAECLEGVQEGDLSPNEKRIVRLLADEGFLHRDEHGVYRPQGS
jgi:hypothetical protein